MQRKCAVLIALACVADPRAAGAQMAPTPAQCVSIAAQVAGMPLPSPSDSSIAGLSWDLLRSCGATGKAAVAAALQSPAVLAETDSARVLEFFSTFRGVQDATLFSALKATVQNSNASGPVRAEAVSALGALYRPFENFLPSYFLMTNPVPSFCPSAYNVGTSSGDPASLPADILDQVLVAMRIAEADGSASQSVRGAAHCWRITLEQKVPPVGSKLLLTYMCGNRFRVRNSNTAPANVTSDVYKTTEKHAFVVYPGIDYFFGNLNKGTVRLFFNGQLVQTKANGGKPCT